MAQFLPNVLPVQANLAQNLSSLQLNQQNRDRAIKMALLQQFVQRIHAENAQKKSEDRRQDARQQQQVQNFGTTLGSAFIGGLGGGAGAGVPAGLQGAQLASNIGGFQSKNSNVNIDSFLGPATNRKAAVAGKATQATEEETLMELLMRMLQGAGNVPIS